ncbi:hypothetical protein GCM10027059_25870 [Myceligenerans halotolerans]
MATQKNKAAQARAERVKVKGPNGRTVSVSPSAAKSLLKNKNDYTRVGGPPAPDYPDGPPAKDWTGANLKAWAKDNDIDLAGATTKADMLAAITAATTQAPPEE